MDKTKAIIFAFVQGTELAEGHGRGYTLAGLESLYVKMTPNDRASAESLARHFQVELERQGFAVLPKETPVGVTQMSELAPSPETKP